MVYKWQRDCEDHRILKFGKFAWIYVGIQKREGIHKMIDYMYVADKVILHDKYEEYRSAHNNTHRNPYDIALIQLSQSVDFTKNNGYYKVNSICLPQKNYTQEKEELAQVIGWGKIRKNENVSIDAEKLQMGYMNAIKTTNDHNDHHGRILRLVRTNENSAMPCSVSNIINIIFFCSTSPSRVQLYRLYGQFSTFE